MQTFIIEVLDDKAVPLLRDLENLNILRIKPAPELNTESILTAIPKLSEQFWGTISSETALKMHEHIKTTRNEWERNI